MYIYFDESFIFVNGVRYVFLGCIAYTSECKENFIYKEFFNLRNKLKNRPEIKYSEVTNQILRDKILNKIKSNSLFYTHFNQEIPNPKDVHKMINKLIEKSLNQFSSKFKVLNLKIIYDKSTYIIDETDLKNKFSFIKNIRMRNSKIFAGLQHADWIVGEAANNFRNKKLVR